MGRFEVLKSKTIMPASVDITTLPEKEVMASIDAVTKKLSQYKTITVCEIGNGYLVVDGSKYFKSLKKSGLKKILCYNLGKLQDGEYEIYRLLLNIHQTRLNYLGIAEIVAWLKTNEHKITTISNKTGLDLQTVERYSTLLEFDWNEFNRKQFDSQFSPFDLDR